MFSLRPHALLRIASAMVLVFVSLGFTLAQDDPDPNSPTPVLLSENDSTRALASPIDKGRKSRSSSRIFWGDQKIELFATNIDLMEGEGANAFRLYMKDSKDREYRLPVLEIRPDESRQGVFVVVTQLRDEIGYWPAPSADGDVLIRLTWRGLTSNSVRLGFGATGGKIKDESGAVPTPIAGVSAKDAARGDAPTEELVGYRWSGDRARFLQQATFGSTPDLDARIRRIGLRTWLAEQFDAQYPSVSNPYPIIADMSTANQNADPPAGCGAVNTPDTATYNACIRDHYSMYPIQTWFWREAFYGEPQLRHRVSWSLGQIWVISGVSTQQSSHMIRYHKILSQNAFGNYRNLMKEMTLNPGMGNYLDMMRSTKNSPVENYPREILQLFTIGLYMMNQDGTYQRDAQNNLIPTYDQTTINNFTKVFTGWRDCRVLSATCPSLVPGVTDYTDPMELAPNNHDVTAKTLLNYPGSASTMNIAACTGCNTAAITTYANNSLDQALNNIFNHPNVGPFVSRLLIQHLVTSDPTPAYVGRVAAVFNDNGIGVRGDLKAVVRAILLDPEARGDIKTDPNYGKLREPVQLMTNLFKAFGVKNAALTGPSDGVVSNFANNLGQNPFFSPTVFNYYSADYMIPGTALNGPEFGLMFTGTSIGRANLANSFVYGQVNINLPNTPAGTRLDLAEMQALAAADPTGNLLLDALNWRLMHGRMSANMRSRILTAVLAEPAANTLNRARAAIYLVATSSQFQIQR